MKNRKYNLVAFLTVAPVLVIMGFMKASCAADPDLANAPGTCTLNCVGAKLGSNDMRIRFLTNNLTVNCFERSNANPEVDYFTEIPIRFVIEKRRRILPAEMDPNGTVLGGEIVAGDENDQGADAEKWVPISGISFQPIVASGIGGTSINEVLDLPRFQGIRTPDTEWCTDSCGVGALNLLPRCKANGTNILNLGVSSGALYNTTTINVEVTTAQ